MRSKTILAALGAVLAAVAVAVAVGCGSSGGSSGNAMSANQTDVAFINDMVPHHQGAIEMARLAQRQADHPEIRRLADDIIAGQQGEIATMRSVRNDLGGMDHGGGMNMAGHMGMNDQIMGMGMDQKGLRTAMPFDRAFIDMMIPHHRGAVRMANAQLAKGKNPTLNRLATAIVAAQTREIAQMRAWRKQWYGSAAAVTGAGPGQSGAGTAADAMAGSG